MTGSSPPSLSSRQYGSAPRVPIQYGVEPEKNLALARNRAVESAEGTFVAFIDDDEFPSADWLVQLYEACHLFKADGVLGPVNPHFEEAPPPWLVQSGVVQRPRHPTGQVLAVARNTGRQCPVAQKPLRWGRTRF